LRLFQKQNHQQPGGAEINANNSSFNVRDATTLFGPMEPAQWNRLVSCGLPVGLERD
jgi:hypothetical protein